MWAANSFINVDSMESEKLPKVQLAAGGIVWRKMSDGWTVAVIHRPKYDDWSLPKGKVDSNESLAEAARREIHEEIGAEVDFLDFAGTTHYPLGHNKHKVVLFWNMLLRSVAFKTNDEVAELLWLGRAEAINKLSYQYEKDLLSQSAAPD